MANKSSYIQGFIIKQDEKVENKESSPVEETATIASTKNIIATFHEFTVQNYLKKKMVIDINNSKAIFQNYSSLFTSIISISKGSNLLNLNGNNAMLFEQVEDILKNSKSIIPLFVKSYAGYGKTEFLSALYQYLYFRFQNKQSSKLPIYISLHHYNKFIYPENKNFTQNGFHKLSKDVTDIFSYLKKHKEQEVIIIIDGTDEFHNPKVNLDEDIFNMITNLEVKGQIIGLRKYINKHTFTYRKEKKIFQKAVPELEIELNRVKTGSPNYMELIKSFSEIESISITNESPDLLVEYINDKVTKFDLKEIDLFHLFLFSKGFQNLFKYGTAESLSSFYKIYIEDCHIDITQIAELAFKTFNTPRDITNEEKNSRIWWKIQKHDSLREYLTAYNIAEKLIDYTENSNDVFNFVYPYELNTFCKEIINENDEKQKEAFNSIKKLIKTADDLTAKTHFCYILGRFKDDEVKSDAINLLRKLERSVHEEIRKRIPLDSTKKLDVENKKYLLYYRTICISLICLEEKDASANYIKQLINNKYFDNLNRGFHLEYYEDIIFSPASPDSLKHEDNLESFTKTFNRLHNKLFKSLTNKDYYPLFQVELYTICSLAQHRQANGYLEEEKRKHISSLIELTLEQSDVICQELKTYLFFMKDRLLEGGKFKTASFIKDFYYLKKLPRRGWVERNIDNPESVASHMYGALLLAYIHLPYNMEDEPGYDKKEIIRMLLIHDIGETYTGDLTPKEKTSLMEKKEEEQLEYLNLVGTYEGISSKLDLLNLYSNFTHNKKDINCIIAREIDKLDNLLQLYIYHNESLISDFEYFKNDLEQKINTKIGTQIMKQIEELFE